MPNGSVSSDFQLTMMSSPQLVTPRRCLFTSTLCGAIGSRGETRPLSARPGPKGDARAR